MLWNDRIQALVIKRVLDGIATMAELSFKERSSLNTLVLIDEAHRLAPREVGDDDAAQRVRARLIDAVRTTRKYGLGWMFISQTLASLHREIIQQLRIMFLGSGFRWAKSSSRSSSSWGPADHLWTSTGCSVTRTPRSTFEAANMHS